MQLAPPDPERVNAALRDVANGAVRDADEVARVMRARDELGQRQGIVVANPIPAEQQWDPAEHDRVLAEAFAAAELAGVRGKAVTPFLLGFIVDASEGRSLEVNLDLARNNVRVAADITAQAGWHIAVEVTCWIVIISRFLDEATQLASTAMRKFSEGPPGRKKFLRSSQWRSDRVTGPRRRSDAGSQSGASSACARARSNSCFMV